MSRVEEKRAWLSSICDQNDSCPACPIRIPCELKSPKYFPKYKSDEQIEEMARMVSVMREDPKGEHDKSHDN